jgi:beta-phosphoglucomutase
MAIRAFIFDLDGVITDTAEYHFQAWKRLADEKGIPFDREDNEALRGVSRRESLNRMLKGRTISEEEAQSWMAYKNQIYVDLVRQMTPADILPGVVTLLNELRAAGLRCAIASASKNAADVVELLGIRGYFDALCDGFSVERTKPAPDLFLFAAMKLGIPAAECVVVEDAEAGVQAAKAGGMFAIGLGPVERVGAADLVLPSLDYQHLNEILAALSR